MSSRLHAARYLCCLSLAACLHLLRCSLHPRTAPGCSRRSLLRRPVSSAQTVFAVRFFCFSCLKWFRSLDVGLHEVLIPSSVCYLQQMSLISPPAWRNSADSHQSFVLLKLKQQQDESTDISLSVGCFYFAMKLFLRHYILPLRRKTDVVRLRDCRAVSAVISASARRHHDDMSSSAGDTLTLTSEDPNYHFNTIQDSRNCVVYHIMTEDYLQRARTTRQTFTSNRLA